MIANSGFFELIRLSFVQRAAMAGIFTSLACSLLGVFLLPRRFAMIGDGLAHFALFAVGLALWLQWTPLSLLLPFMVLAALLILRLPLRTMIFGDAAIGMISVTGLALGILLSSLRGGFNVDLFSYLFGDILAVSPPELLAVISTSALVMLIVLLLFHELVAITADPAHARLLGIQAERLDRLLAVLTAVTVAVGLRTTGALLISSFLIFPATAALQMARSFKTAALASALFGSLAVLLGLGAALRWNWPAAPAMTLSNLAILCMATVVGRLRR